MLRSPQARVWEHPGEAVLVIVLLAAALALPSAVVFGSVSLRELASDWTGDLRPVVYLRGDRRSGPAEELAEELRNWESVRTVTIRSSREAYRETRDRIGASDVEKLGLTAEMFPYSLVVESSRSFPVDASLLAKLESLETRSDVEMVDLPGERVRALSKWARRGAVGGVVLLVLFTVLAVYRLASFLARLERRDRRQRRLLERFGAAPSRLRRTPWWRGGAVGLWAGLLGFGSLVVFGFFWHSLEVQWFGGHDQVVWWRWLLTASPLVLGPVVGLAVGVRTGGRRRGLQDELARSAGLESLLEYDDIDDE